MPRSLGAMPRNVRIMIAGVKFHANRECDGILLSSNMRVLVCLFAGFASPRRRANPENDGAGFRRSRRVSAARAGGAGNREHCIRGAEAAVAIPSARRAPRHRLRQRNGRSATCFRIRIRPFAGEPGAVHELRQVISVDGRKIEDTRKPRTRWPRPSPPATTRARKRC